MPRGKDYSEVAVVDTLDDENDIDNTNNAQTCVAEPESQCLDATEITDPTTATTLIPDDDDDDDAIDDYDDDDDDHRDHDNNVITTTNHHNSQVIITVDDAIERLGTGKFQIIVLVAAGLCFAADAMQVLLLSFLSEVLRLEWNLTDSETAMITSILFIGAIFGTLSLGPLADKKGRKPVFLLAASIISGFGIATAMVTNYWTLLANLFMVGWGVGGLVVPFDILSEFLPADSRGKNLLVIEYFWTVGKAPLFCFRYETVIVVLHPLLLVSAILTCCSNIFRCPLCRPLC